jgi:hypothetical protein
MYIYGNLRIARDIPILYTQEPSVKMTKPIAALVPLKGISFTWALGHGFDLPLEDHPMKEFSTIPVTKFLKREVVMQERDGTPRPRYRMEV